MTSHPSHTECSRSCQHLHLLCPCVCRPHPVFLSVRSFSSSPRETVLRWLFPDAELCPLLDNTGTTLQRCQLGTGTDPHHTVSQQRLLRQPSPMLVRDTLRYIVLCCCRECRCWVGWWSLTVLQLFVFFPSSDAKTTAAPSACGWSREIWVRRSHDLTSPRPRSSVSMTCVCWCVRSVRRPALLADGAASVRSAERAV